ncbi:hypothetical protein Gogos_014453, partial [Gossypium gossypioides]|nr:hypothetical protein [Gossypium gossypioides]
ELQREGHHVTVFEKANKVGAPFIVAFTVPSNYYGLPFVKKEGGGPRSFPGHEEVLRFLEDFARDFGLMELIRFGHEVIRVERVDETNHKWIVEFRTRETEPRWEEVFEAVVICNGRDIWPGLQMHSHNYRTLEQFENKVLCHIQLEFNIDNNHPAVVVLIGDSASAHDILKQIASVAKQVHQAIRGPSFQLKRLENHDNVLQHSMIECTRKDGKVLFQNGSIVNADVILHCT